MFLGSGKLWLLPWPQETAARAARGEPPAELSKPGAYFYVEGTFYHDRRQLGASDLSEPVLAAAREAGAAAPPHPPPGAADCSQQTTAFSSAAMEGTAFEDLWLRLGQDAANLYCHQVRGAAWLLGARAQWRRAEASATPSQSCMKMKRPAPHCPALL